MKRQTALWLGTALSLAACSAPNPQTTLPPRVNSVTVAPADLPAMRRFGPAAPPSPRLSNADLARDFVDLSFNLESGRPVARFTRFESPIGVQLVGDIPPTLLADLDDLLGRLRTEAQIDIARDRPGPSQITINVVPRTEVRRLLPQAACFVVPNVATPSDFRAARRQGRLDWTNLTERRNMAVFLPGDVAPQEIRDCLHEEIAQALGPLNDLYRLPQSIFNDDNMHTVLTRHDMLILRATYDPSLRNGMSRAEVTSRLPAIFARINPEGRGVPGTPVDTTPRAWVEAINAALGPGTSDRQRLRNGQTALNIAQQRNWRDVRLGFSHFTLGRLYGSNEPLMALAHFAAADQVFASRSETTLHRAFVTSNLSAALLSVGDPQAALSRLDPAIEIARQNQNAGLLATLLLLKAGALEQLGQVDAATAVRLDSLGWARYGFDSVAEVLDHARDVSALRPAARN